MTAFIIISIILFFISIISNIIYILNPDNIFKGGAIFGLICFTSMIIWAIFLLIQR